MEPLHVSSSKIQSLDPRRLPLWQEWLQWQKAGCCLRKSLRGRSMKRETLAKTKFHLWSQTLWTLSHRDAKKAYNSWRPGCPKSTKLQGKMEACGLSSDFHNILVWKILCLYAKLKPVCRCPVTLETPVGHQTKPVKWVHFSTFSQQGRRKQPPAGC